MNLFRNFSEPKPKEDLKIHPIKKDDAKVEPEAKPEPIPEEPKAPVAPPSPEPVVELADEAINITVDPEERDPDGKWVIVKKPQRYDFQSKQRKYHGYCKGGPFYFT